MATTEYGQRPTTRSITPKSRSGCTMRQSSRSRSKGTTQQQSSIESIHTTKSDNIINNQSTTINQNQQLYLPLKDIKNYGHIQLLLDDNYLLPMNSKHKVWETKMYEKNQGQQQQQQLRRKSTTLCSNLDISSCSEWLKYENNYNNWNMSSKENGSKIHWSSSIIENGGQDQDNVFSRHSNFKMTYNRVYEKEPIILENKQSKLIMNPSAPAADETNFLELKIDNKFQNSTQMKTDLYTELYKNLNENLTNSKCSSSSPIIPCPRDPDDLSPSHTSNYISKKRLDNNKKKTNKSVSFAPGTIFFERNLNSYFWHDILKRQKIRKLQRKKLLSTTTTNNSIHLSKSSTNISIRSSCRSSSSSNNNNSNKYPTESLLISNHHHGTNHHQRRNTNSFWNGIRHAFRTIFGSRESTTNNIQQQNQLHLKKSLSRRLN